MINYGAPPPSRPECGMGVASVPTPMDQARETLRHLTSVEVEASLIQRTLFFEDRSECPLLPPDAPLAEMLSQICSRTASLVGYLSTINKLLGEKVYPLEPVPAAPGSGRR